MTSVLVIEDCGSARSAVEMFLGYMGADDSGSEADEWGGQRITVEEVDVAILGLPPLERWEFEAWAEITFRITEVPHG